ncbi:MAG: FKBP-type peptidyl-prolyl cis-trans isomerase [Bacteroidota bacterium]
MSVKIKFLVTSIVAIMFLISCGGLDDSEFLDSDEIARLDDATITDFLAANNITAQKDEDTGIYYTVDTANESGASAVGKICGVYYEASVLGGNTYDEHTDADGESLLMKQGSSAIVPVGLDFGLSLMREGETYTFYLPSQRSYGGFSVSSLIPANAVIQIVVTVDRVLGEVDVLDLETDAIDDYIEANNLNDTDENPVEQVQTLATGVRFKLLVEGSGTTLPQVNQTVSVFYRGSFLNGEIFDQTDNNAFTFPYNSQSVIGGFFEGTGLLNEGDKALVMIPSNSAYGESVRVIPDLLKNDLILNNIIPGYAGSIDPYTILLFEIEMVNIQ